MAKQKHMAHSGGLVRLIAAMIIVGILFVTTPLRAVAVEPTLRQVRVGYNVGDTHYFNVDELGAKGGYYYEFMQELAKFAGWECEYIPYDSWSDCLTALHNGEIDLLAPTKYSDDRHEYAFFPSINMGQSFTALVVPLSSHLGENAMDKLDGIRLGTLADDLNTQQFREYAKREGISFVEREYKSTEERQLALQNGEIDAIAKSSMTGFTGYRVLAKFSLEPYYCVTNNNNLVIQEELTHALSELNMRNPAFISELYARYYSEDIIYQTFLTEEEREYIKSRGTIRAVITPGAEPVSYMKEGVFSGIVADVMASIAQNLGVTFEFIEPPSYQAALEMVSSGEADILCSFGGDYNWAEQNGLIFTTSYVENLYNIVSLKKVSGVIDQIGLIKGFYVNNTVQKLYPDAEYTFYETEQQAVEALADHRLDAICISTFIAEHIMPRYYNRFNSFTIKNYSSHLSIGMSQNTDGRLYNVLDKQVNVIKSNKIDSVLAAHTRKDFNDFSITDFVYRNPIIIINGVLILAIIVVAVVLYIFYSRKEHNDHVFSLAYTDKLTGMWNSAYLQEKMPAVLLRNPHRLFAMVSLDISKFTAINESHGRAMGDKVICFVAKQLNRYSVDATMVARVQADHFLLLVAYTTHEALARVLARIRSDTKLYTEGDISIRLMLNMGIYLLRHGEKEITSIIDMAEMARRETKAGIARTVYFDQYLEQRLRREKTMEDCMQSALCNKEFVVYYQPKYNILTNRICGAEALVRWNSPTMGFLGPIEFIPLLESNGFIVELDAFVLETTIILQRKRMDMGLELIPLSVNQSRMNFGDEGYFDRLRTLCDRYGLPHGVIELEITETAFANQSVIESSCRALKEIGFRISVDDYGSEYSSPTMLREASLDVLKIDRGLLHATETSDRGKIIVRKTVELAQELGMEVICEGVELLVQVEFLKSVGCILAQGYYFARPMPEQDFIKLLAEEQTIIK